MQPDLGSLHMPTTPLKYVKPHHKLVVPYTSHRQIVDLWGKWARKSSVILIVVGWVLDNEAIFIVLTSWNPSLANELQCISLSAEERQHFDGPGRRN